MVKNTTSFNKIDNPDVAVVFASYPDEIRSGRRGGDVFSDWELFFKFPQSEIGD